MTSIRETFLPDEGCVMVRCDLSQIEDRMCKMYCGTERMVELANRKPWEYDAHTDNASAIFGKAHDEITKDERYLGKRTTHASQRGMRGNKLSENISKDTDGEMFLHPKRCDKLIDKYLDAMWEIRDIYFPWVRQQVRDVGVLVNSWGRRLDLRKRRIDDDVYREAYSFYMQSENADWTNQYLFIPMHYYMMATYGRPCNAQNHDEVIVSAPYKDSYNLSKIMVVCAEQKREVPAGSGHYLTAPAEIIVGNSWGDKRFEFKQLPTEKEYFEQTEPLRDVA
jgi:DNA polymerase I-like protein with 3'-5' exonuclease and polymerase domains